MEATIQDFWFEVFKTNEDESTETVYSSEKINKALIHSEDEEGLQVDLWVVDGQNDQMPVPIMAVTTETTLEEIEKGLSEAKVVSTDLKELILEKLKKELPIGETNKK